MTLHQLHSYHFGRNRKANAKASKTTPSLPQHAGASTVTEQLEALGRKLRSVNNKYQVAVKSSQVEKANKLKQLGESILHKIDLLSSGVNTRSPACRPSPRDLRQYRSQLRRYLISMDKLTT